MTGSVSTGVTVAAGGTLAGTGVVAGAVTLSGTITAGTGPTAADAPGTLTTGVQTWLAGSTYAAKLTPTAADQLILSGLSTDSTGLTVVPVLAEAFAAGSYSFLIADAAGSSTAFDALLASGALTAESPAGTTADLQAAPDANGGEDLFLGLTVAAPEPAGLLLVASAVAPLALGRRRRRA